MHPAVDAQQLLGRCFVEAVRRLGDHHLLRGGERTCLRGEAVNGGVVAVGGDQRHQGLDQVPRRAVHPRFVARVDVTARSATPALAARDQLELDHALGAEGDGHLAVKPLRGHGHEDSDTAPEGGLHLRPAHDLGKMRRTDLLLSLGYEHEVERELAARAANGVKRGEKRRLRTLLVHSAAPHEHLSQLRLFDERGFPRWRGPLGGVRLLDVVHEIEAQGARSAGVE